MRLALLFSWWCKVPQARSAFPNQNLKKLRVSIQRKRERGQEERRKARTLIDKLASANQRASIIADREAEKVDLKDQSCEHQGGLSKTLPTKAGSGQNRIQCCTELSPCHTVSKYDESVVTENGELLQGDECETETILSEPRRLRLRVFLVAFFSPLPRIARRG